MCMDLDVRVRREICNLPGLSESVRVTFHKRDSELGDVVGDDHVQMVKNVIFVRIYLFIADITEHH